MDKFFIHQKFNSRVSRVDIRIYVLFDRNYLSDNFQHIFPDATNKMIFVTEDNGMTVTSYNVSFVPSEIAIHPTQSKVFLAHDKVDPTRTVSMPIIFSKMHFEGLGPLVTSLI